MGFSITQITSGRGTSVLVPQSNPGEDFRMVYRFIELGQRRLSAGATGDKSKFDDRSLG
jgi:hypothetical protein